jgi:hypothetical protein
VVDSKISGNHFIFDKYNTLLPATLKVLEALLETILLKPFPLFRRILNYVSSIIKAPSIQR